MKEKTRAVIYCRVSTTSDSQVESLEKQVKEAVSAVEQLGFELVDQFIDEGKTGTTKEARKEYQRMLSEIGEGKFDVIVTKSLDRMNRNILDFYLFLDIIIKNQIRLYFYLDHNYYKPDDKIVIGIKAILAEEYSTELSKKLRNAHARRQERGEVVMLSSMTYGYRKVARADGSKYVDIVETEADMIRLIFDLCKQGYGSRAIGKYLYERGYRNRKGNEITETTIRRIIRNPLVKGTMIMNKVKFDFNTKLTSRTDPSQWIWKEGAVPAIISAEDWQLANRMMDSRGKKKNGAVSVRHGYNPGKYHFSGKLVCGLCGKPYYKAQRKRKADQVQEWRCSTYLKFGRTEGEKFKTNSTKKTVDIGVGCDNPAVQEEILIEILQETAEKEFSNTEDKYSLINETLDVLRKIMESAAEDGREEELRKKHEMVRQRKETLLIKYLDGKIQDKDYSSMEQKLGTELEELEAQLAKISHKQNEARQVEQRLKNIKGSLEAEGVEQATAYTVLEAVEKIVIYPDYLEIIFDSLKILGVDSYGFLESREEFSVKVSLEKYRRKHDNLAIERSKEEIYRLLRENPSIRLQELADRLDMGKRTVYARIKLLRDEGRVRSAGHGKGAVWITEETVFSDKEAGE